MAHETSMQSIHAYRFWVCPFMYHGCSLIQAHMLPFMHGLAVRGVHAFCVHALRVPFCIHVMHAPSMHACVLLTCSFLWRAILLNSGCQKKMAYFEQAACLATAWANDDEISTLGAKQSLCVINGKKLMRRFLDLQFIEI